MRYRVTLTAKVQKFIKKLSARDYKLVANALEGLAVDPYAGDVKKMKTYDKTFRKRAGNYRIIYEIDGDILLVDVLDIGDRKNIYE
jgi:mRNA interferase RelE/StbE